MLMGWFPVALVETRGAPATASDDAAILREAETRILKHRTTTLTVEVRNQNGQALVGIPVTVTHRAHRFYFGAGFDMRLLPREDETEVDRSHRAAFLQLFNYATVHLYWAGYEPQRGAYQDAQRSQAIAWLKQNDLAARGHPIFWNHRAGVPRWLEESPPDLATMQTLLDTRLEQLSRTVLGGLRDVDVFNELTQWERFTNTFTRYTDAQGKMPIAVHYLKETKRLNSALLTVVNDYDTSPAYARLLEQLLQAGAPIDIIGQQSHMHSGPWPLRQVVTVLDRLSALDRPILFTELSVLSAPRRTIDWKTEKRFDDWLSDPAHEQEQADYLERFLTVAYSHPRCMGVVLWNYSDRGAWLGAPVGLLRRDGSPKPSFDRLRGLINDRWRTRRTVVTDARGVATVTNAFEGRYGISIPGASRTMELIGGKSQHVEIQTDADATSPPR